MKLVTNVRSVPVNNGSSTQLAGPNSRRVAIEFSFYVGATGLSSSNIVLANLPLTGFPDDKVIIQATPINSGRGPFLIGETGEIINHEWHCWCATAGIRCAVIETIDEDLCKCEGG